MSDHHPEREPGGDGDRIGADDACTAAAPRQGSLVRLRARRTRQERRMWPPSRIPIGIRLTRLRKKPGIGESAAGDRSRLHCRKTRQASAPIPPATGPATETSALRHGSNGWFAQRDVGAEEGDEDGQLRIQPLTPRLDVVTELVDEDEQHEADAEAPPPDEGVAAHRDEDAEELQRPGDLQQHCTGNGNGREQAPEPLTLRPAAPGVSGSSLLTTPARPTPRRRRRSPSSTAAPCP